MKTIVSRCLLMAVSVVVASLLLTVGSVAAAAQPAGPSSKSGGPQQFFSVGGGTTGGAFFIVAAAMATVLEKNVPGIKVTAESTAASTENGRRLGRGELDLGLVAADVAYYAARGAREFARDGRKYDNLRVMMCGYSSPLQMFTLAQSNIKTVEDIRGKRVYVLTGTTIQAHLPAALKAFGITNKDYKETAASTEAIVDAVREGQADVGIISGGAPLVAVTDLTTRHSVRFLPVPPEKAAQIRQENAWYVPGVIKAGVYRGMTQDVPSVEVPIFLMTRQDLDTELVYRMTKALAEHTADLEAVYPLAAAFTAEQSTKTAPIVPFHPSAERYYKERGLLK
jgi:TRAP transporter TAXI family solute receptor